METLGRRRSSLTIGALALTAIVGFGLDTAGLAPWLLITTALAAIVLVLGQRLPWSLAVALGVVGMLGAYVLFVRVVQPIGLDLGLKNRLGLAVVVAVALVLLARAKALTLPTRSAAPLVVALAPIVIFLVVATIGVALSQGDRVAWSMQNDATWNTMMARTLWTDQGLSVEHPNVSPLIPALLAASFASGRVGLPATELLMHDVTGQSVLWLLLVLASSVLAAVVAWRGLPRMRTVPRAVATFAVAGLGLLWYAAGYSFQFGFFNATVSLIAMLCAWIAWTSIRTHRLAAAVILSASSIVLLATWAPLAIMSLGLGVALLVTAGRSWWSTITRGRAVTLGISLAILPAYLVAFTLPDILREGKGLASNGAIMAIEPRHVAVAVAIALTAFAVHARVTRNWQPALGAAVVTGTSAIAIVYLMLQRPAGESRWGYYPAKLSWLVIAFLVTIVAVALLDLASRPALRSRRIALVAVGAVAVAVLTCLPLPTLTVVRAMVTAYLPVQWVVPSETMHTLFRLSDPASLNIVSKYLEPSQEPFINNWLIQQYADGGDDPIRAYAYGLVDGDAGQLCQLAALAEGGITVHTSDESWGQTILDNCPANEVTIVVD